MRARLLIVDDDIAMVEQLRWAFKEDYDVVYSFGDKEEIFSLVKSGVDLVSLDLNLSKESSEAEGIDLLTSILREDPLIKVVVITASDRKDYALSCIERGAFDFLTKPIDVKELAVIFKRAVHIKRLEEEIKKLRLPGELSFMGIVGKSEVMKRVFNMIQVVAPNDYTVLITGESGTGKELVARALHNLSYRKGKPFVVVNCGAIPENLLESELFGYKKGAFTGAVSDKKGKFEMANGGTIFLDEIGDMPLSLQVKLLRVLQDKVIQPVGSNEEVSLDVRIIAATNSDLKQKVRDGTFREDLYYRLNVISIELPPLRKRGDDVILLSQFFVDKFCRQMGKEICSLSEGAVKKLSDYSWPGNVRQLEHTILRAVVLATGKLIDENLIELEEDGNRAFSDRIGDNAQGNLILDGLPMSLRKAKGIVEQFLIERALSRCNGNISSAAKILEISRPQLYSLIEKYGIEVR